MPIISTTKMTAQQFLQLGEDPPGVRLELVDGEIAVSPSPIPDHSHVDSMLRYLLLQHIVKHDLGRLYGDVDTLFGRHDVRRPDIIYFSKARLHLVGRKAMEGPPDLCVEIISPSSAEIDRIDKFELYEKGGVAHYWIVDPAQRTIEGFRLDDGRYVPSGRGCGDDIVHLPPFADLDLPLGMLWHPA
jgi:Uma2 family endonuclease